MGRTTDKNNAPVSETAIGDQNELVETNRGDEETVIEPSIEADQSSDTGKFSKTDKDQQPSLTTSSYFEPSKDSEM